MSASPIMRAALRRAAVQQPRQPSLRLRPASVQLNARALSSSINDGADANPTSSASAEEGDIKSSRATDSTPQKDGASLQTPVTNPSAGQGQDEEGGDPAKRDPSKPAGQKAKEVEKEGMKPLDAANK